jgi:hypothetical protein
MALIIRVIHDLWKLLQEMISLGICDQRVLINVCQILDGYGVMTTENLE